ncbi:MAG TPA: phosphoribosylformylglycinamidine synthase subunit PurQ [Ktedonobacterales bacterium]|nr:phosphoribosylformylglycinamidine synthase subunit PurQ [Ktedonobacterales bacterium]
MKFAVIVFPGSNCDEDAAQGVRRALGDAAQADLVWHTTGSLDGYDAVIVPGGFSYGDYLRAGAIARFAPVMEALRRHAAAGRPVLGICNGFQVLTEAGLLPGALLPNDALQFRCQQVALRVETTATPFTGEYAAGQIIHLPIAHGQGAYYADAATLEELRARDQIVFRYAAENPNGSLDAIAGIVNRARNVLGMMPHPERAVHPLLGSTDGTPLFASLLRAWKEAVVHA